MNSELLYITRKLGFPSSFGTRSGLGDFLEQYPDGIYAENGGGAPIGWESAAVWFGGDSERAAARFERMMAERNELSRLFRTRVSGVLVLTFIYRLKSRMVTAIPIVGGQPAIDPTWLYFTMPQGGTVSLTKNGTPTEVTLEYSLDNGTTWTTWVESENVRSLTLAAGQIMHVRNTSETSTGFNTDSSNYYNFAFTANTYAGGNTDSLLCKNPSNAISSNYCFTRLFLNCSNLLSPPLLPSLSVGSLSYSNMFKNSGITYCPELPATTLQTSSYIAMFKGCNAITTTPVLPALHLPSHCYDAMFSNCSSLTIISEISATSSEGDSCMSQMFYGCGNITTSPELRIEIASNYLYNALFYGCTKLNQIRTLMTDISATACIQNWVYNVSPTGDFYCPAELTIPTGASGIPSGWTRHDI